MTGNQRDPQMRLTAISLVVAIAVPTGSSAFNDRTLGKRPYDGIVSAPPSPTIRSVSVPTPAGDAPLRLSNVRLEPAPDFETAPSMNVSFDLANDSTVSFTNIVIQIRILKDPAPSSPTSVSTVLAGPFSIRTKIVFEPAFTINYQLRLRNLSPDCDCIPQVEIMSYRPAR